MASGSEDKTVKLWSVEPWTELTTLKGHKSNVYSVAFSPDGKYLASGSDDKSVKLWSVESYKQVNTLQGHSSLIYSAAVSPDK